MRSETCEDRTTCAARSLPTPCGIARIAVRQFPMKLKVPANAALANAMTAGRAGIRQGTNSRGHAHGSCAHGFVVRRRRTRAPASQPPGWWNGESRAQAMRRIAGRTMPPHCRRRDLANGGRRASACPVVLQHREQSHARQTATDETVRQMQDLAEAIRQIGKNASMPSTAMMAGIPIARMRSAVANASSAGSVGDVHPPPLPPGVAAGLAIQQHGKGRAGRTDEDGPGGTHDAPRREADGHEHHELQAERHACRNPVQTGQQRQRGEECSKQAVYGID